VEIAQRASRGEVGRISVGCGPAPQSWILERVFSLFLSRHPDVQIELHSLYTQEQVEALGTGRIQVSFPLLPIPHRGLVVETIGEEPLVVALPAAHRLARRDAVHLKDLREESFILVSREVGPSFFNLVLRACTAAGFIPHVAHEASRVEPVLAFVAAGLGISLQPRAVGEGHHEGIVFRSFLPPVPAIEIGMAYRRDETSPALSAFRAVVREVAREKYQPVVWEPARRLSRPPGEIHVFRRKNP
jgi:DNA-binding transcriptional LysR family regulator